jgi:hypothetical protein
MQRSKDRHIRSLECTMLERRASELLINETQMSQIKHLKANAAVLDAHVNAK